VQANAMQECCCWDMHDAVQIHSGLRMGCYAVAVRLNRCARGPPCNTMVVAVLVGVAWHTPSALATDCA
jgi:hypothetical protein